MATFKLRPQANIDLLSIWRASQEKFGTAQADRYIELLNEKMEMLTENPLIGKNRAEIKINYRSFRVESHVIFFRQENYGISISRILHKRMDFLTYL